MKKLIILTFLFITFFTVSFAQKSGFEYGINKGVIINTAYGNGIAKDYKKILTRFGTGVHAKYILSEFVGIKAGIQYDQNGWQYKGLTFVNIAGTGLTKGDVVYKLDYLNIPISVELVFGKKIKFKTSGGLFAGFLLNNKLTTTQPDSVSPNPPIVTTTKSQSIKSTNFGLSIAAGAQFPISSKLKFDVDVQNNIGLMNINKGQNKINTNAIAVKLGLVFCK